MNRLERLLREERARDDGTPKTLARIDFRQMQVIGQKIKKAVNRGAGTRLTWEECEVLLRSEFRDAEYMDPDAEESNA